MKKLSIIFMLLAIIFATTLFADEEKNADQNVPTQIEGLYIDTVQLTFDAIVQVVCIDGYKWFIIFHKDTSTATQMREMKDGKEVLAKCKCEEGL
jgi:hypothetical protein